MRVKILTMLVIMILIISCFVLLISPVMALDEYKFDTNIRVNGALITYTIDEAL